MRKIIILLVLTLLRPSLCANSITKEIIDRIVSPSVKLSSQGVYEINEELAIRVTMIGSGVIFVHKETCYVLTAGHIVEHLRVEREIVREGKRHITIEWQDAQVIQDIAIVHEGLTRRVGQLLLDAKVIAYSPKEEEDLAVLEVYRRGLLKHGARLAPPDFEPHISMEVYHIGTLFGELTGSLGRGIIAAMGRVFNGRVYHQCSSTAAPGSSGGGVWTFIDNKAYYIGMLSTGIRGRGDVNFFTPIHRIRKWLEKVKLKNLLNAG